MWAKASYVLLRIDAVPCGGIDVLDLLKAFVAGVVVVREIHRQDVAGRGDRLEPIRGVEVAVRSDPCNPGLFSCFDLCQPVGLIPSPFVARAPSFIAGLTPSPFAPSPFAPSLNVEECQEARFDPFPVHGPCFLTRYGCSCSESFSDVTNCVFSLR
jgi:hypothetical protein